MPQNIFICKHLKTKSGIITNKIKADTILYIGLFFTNFDLETLTIVNDYIKGSSIQKSSYFWARIEKCKHTR